MIKNAFMLVTVGAVMVPGANPKNAESPVHIDPLIQENRKGVVKLVEGSPEDCHNKKEKIVSPVGKCIKNISEGNADILEECLVRWLPVGFPEEKEDKNIVYGNSDYRHQEYQVPVDFIKETCNKGTDKPTDIYHHIENPETYR